MTLVLIEKGIIGLQLVVFIGQLTYIVYAFILMRQTKILNESLITPASLKIKVIAIVHFWLAVILATLTVFTLNI